MTIAIGDRVRRNPACYEHTWPGSAWLNDEGTVTRIEESRIFNCRLATVRWKHVVSQVEVGRLQKIDERAVA